MIESDNPIQIQKKTARGVIWALLEAGGLTIFSFAIGIILARLLSPKDFGIVSLTTIFITISKGFIDGGFTSALIQKKDSNELDYSSVFYYNILLSIGFSIVLNFLASTIASWYAVPELKNIIHIISLGLIIEAIGNVQMVLLRKYLQFKILAKISLFKTLIYAIISITLAFLGFSAWSIVYATLLSSFVQLLIIWNNSNWKPKLVFSMLSLKSMFGFGSRIMLINLVHNIFNNLYQLVIGKFFSVRDLGLYTRADGFQALPINAVTEAFVKVYFPSMSQMQNDIKSLKIFYADAIKMLSFAVFNIVGIIFVSSKYLVLTLVGEKWLESVQYLQLLCFVGIFYPLYSLNVSLLQVKGLSAKLLNLEVLKKISMLPLIGIGIYCKSIQSMLILLIIHSFIFYIIYAYNSGSTINYGVIEQILDFKKNLFLATSVSTITITILYLTNQHFSHSINLVFATIIYAIFFIVLNQITKNIEYLTIKQTIVQQFYKFFSSLNVK